jgi:hypothetical protein
MIHRFQILLDTVTYYLHETINILMLIFSLLQEVILFLWEQCSLTEQRII